MRLLPMVASVLIVLSSAPELAGAQGVPHPLDRILLGVDSMSIAIVQGQDTVPVGELWDEVGIIDGPDGKPMVRRVYRTINRVFGPHLDTTVSSLPDFAPVSTRTYSSVVADSLAFGPKAVSGWVETQTGG